MKVYVAHDGGLRVRIGHENLGSASLGPWYGGTGAIRLRQVHGSWIWGYRLDDHGHRGTTGLPESEFWRVREHLPGARLMHPSVRPTLDIDVPQADLAALRARAAPLRTRVARFGEGMVAMFGDFQIEATIGASLGLFHLGGRRFNGFSTGFHYSALDAADMPGVVARLPSARLVRDGHRSTIEVSGGDLALLLEITEEA